MLLSDVGLHHPHSLLVEQPCTMQTGQWPRGYSQLLFGKRPILMPQLVWRKLRWLRLIVNTMIATGFLYATVLSAGHAGLLDETVFEDLGRCFFDLTAFAGLMLYLGLLATLAIWLRIRGIVRRAHSLSCELCEHCAYHLRGLPTRHACPECGSDYDLDRTRAKWEFIVRLRSGVPWLVVIVLVLPPFAALAVVFLKGCR